jgi:hypothetical protein
VLEDSTYTDAAVVAMSRKFHWVTVLRDSTPEITSRFNVSAYPSLMVIGDDQEKIYRWSGYMRPEPFMAELDEALRRNDLYRSGEEWDTPDPRPASIIDVGRVTTIPAPSENVPSGLTTLRGDLWVAQTGSLFRIDPGTGEVLDGYEPEVDGEAATSVRGLCTDGTMLYGMQYGWTAGKPTFVIDPRTGRIVREIVTEENLVNSFYAASAVVWKDDSLQVLHSGTISRVDPASGEIVSALEIEERLSGLTWNGEQFVGVSREGIHFIDPDSGATLRTIPVNYPLRAIHYHDGVYYLMEQPVFGYNTAHERIRIWPERTLIYKVRLPE